MKNFRLIKDIINVFLEVLSLVILIPYGISLIYFPAAIIAAGAAVWWVSQGLDGMFESYCDDREVED